MIHLVVVVSDEGYPTDVLKLDDMQLETYLDKLGAEEEDEYNNDPTLGVESLHLTVDGSVIVINVDLVPQFK